jgi:hypothetical protein
MKTGDAIASVATPIARVLHMDCIDPATNQLRPESNCNKMIKDFNDGNYVNAVLDRIRKRGKYTEKEN